MDNLDFGDGFAVLLLIIAAVFMLIKTLIILLVTHFMAMGLAPMVTGAFSFKSNVATRSPQHAFVFVVTWLLITPVVTGMALIPEMMLLRDSPGSSSELSQFASFNYINFILLALTPWYYSEDYGQFWLKPFGKILLQWLIFILISFILNLVFGVYLRMRSYEFYAIHYLIQTVVYLAVLGPLAAYYIRRNKRRVQQDEFDSMPERY